MQQLHDGDCGLMTANADKIDYNADHHRRRAHRQRRRRQAGRGEFHGEHMLYNTNTGEMESGDKSRRPARAHGDGAEDRQARREPQQLRFPDYDAPRNRHRKPPQNPAAQH